MSRLHDPNRRQVLQRKATHQGFDTATVGVFFSSSFECKQFLCVRLTFVHVVHELRVICLQEYFALDNLLMSVPCP